MTYDRKPYFTTRLAGPKITTPLTGDL